MNTPVQSITIIEKSNQKHKRPPAQMLLFSWCLFHHRYRKDTKISPVESQLTVGKVNSYFLFKQQPSLRSFFSKRLFQIYEGKIRSSSPMETSESSFPNPDET